MIISGNVGEKLKGLASKDKDKGKGYLFTYVFNTFIIFIYIFEVADRPSL